MINSTRTNFTCLQKQEAAVLPCIQFAETKMDNFKKKNTQHKRIPLYVPLCVAYNKAQFGNHPKCLTTLNCTSSIVKTALATDLIRSLVILEK
jgi:hypothetical protein